MSDDQRLARLLIEFGAATARAERAEAAHRMCSVTEAKLLARIKRAEAAIQRVRALAIEFGAADCDGCNAGDIVTDILAALDSTDPVEAAPSHREAANRNGLVVQHTCGAVRVFDRPPAAGRCGECAEPGAWTQLYRRNDPAPEPGPIERSRAQARAEVELVQRWWLRSGGNRWRMAGPLAAEEMKAKGIGTLRPDQLTVCWDFEFRPSSSRFFDAPPFPLDAQRPEERSDEGPKGCLETRRCPIPDDPCEPGRRCWEGLAEDRAWPSDAGLPADGEERK